MSDGTHQPGLDNEGYLLYLIWLCEELALLASDEPNQERFLRALGTWDLLDELGLQWDDCYLVLRSQDKFAEQDLGIFEKVSETLTAIPAEAWRGQPGLGNEAWAQVRKAAKLALPVAVSILRRINPDFDILCPGTKTREGVFTGTKTVSLPRNTNTD